MISGAFKERIPALKTLFKGDDEEKESETEDELRKLIRFVIRREIPTEFGHMFDEDWWEEIMSKKDKPKSTAPERKVKVVAPDTPAVPATPAAPTPAKEVKKQKMYKRTCGYRNCGRTFLAKHPAALYCPDRNCRILEFQAKKRGKEKKRTDE